MLATVADSAEKTELLSTLRDERAMSKTSQNKNKSLKDSSKEEIKTYYNLAVERLNYLNFLEQKTRKSNKSTKSPYEQEDIAEIPDNYLESVPTDLLYNESDELPSDIQGPPTLQENLKRLVTEYRDCFRSTLSSEAAKVPPFDLQVNQEEWQVPANRLPPRRSDRTRQYEMRKHVDGLLKANIIQPSTAPYYSHSFMVPKPNQKWRMVVDYKNMNKKSESESWPIPNIKEMLHRIGDQKPKYFVY